MCQRGNDGGKKKKSQTKGGKNRKKRKRKKLEESVIFLSFLPLLFSLSLSLSLSLSPSQSSSPSLFPTCLLRLFPIIYFYCSSFIYAARGHPAEPEHGLTTGPPKVAPEQREPCISITIPLMVATGSAPAGKTLRPTSRSWTSGEHEQPVSTNARASVQQVSDRVRPRRSTSPVSWEQSALA